ncbi:DUF3427 domain-containing protein [Kineosporia rhizophila]|uniref:DUF3427 domain-containing protein n=1 Tax=Kineosporia rhizophila TaxID=84633 RepID=UPI0038CBF451
MQKGLYEALLTAELRDRLAQAADLSTEVANVDPSEQPGVLTRYLAPIIQSALEATKAPEARQALVEGILEQLRLFHNGIETPVVNEKKSNQQLLQVYRPDFTAESGRVSLRPATPLSEASLLTNARGEPTLGAELRAELTSADRVDLLCAFVKWYGLRLLKDELHELRNRGVRIRVLTTTYLGATDAKALDALVKDFGAEVKVNYETNRTRLHAKAWMFERNSGFATAYVGSSNLSRSALVEGLEWNVRLSSVGTPDLMEKFRSTFESYWQDKEFISYDPDEQGQHLRSALAEAAGSSPGSHQNPLTLSGLEVRPLPHQQEMLEQLDAERKLHDRHRNLLVAATGTGKTVIAALDYRNLIRERGQDLSLLFIAHRIEILQQAQRTYREVLSDGSFGEILASGHVPERGRHVFASVMSLSSDRLDLIDPNHFDVVVIDEFHHAQASTYQRILEHLKPSELLGLTATPERSDGVNVSAFFGGRVATELRLWDALDQNLLVPFHYFGIHDETHLEDIAWRRGAYDLDALTELYTASTARVRIILKELGDKVLDPHSMKCLGFCVSVKHAEFMAERFREAGIAATSLHAGTPMGERDAARKALRSGEINAIFTVDLFNEGVDIPEVDTVLFLRPTESATVFLQQLGRGLRMSASKAVLTALDFVGHQRKEFRFDQRFKALTGFAGKSLEKQVEAGFPLLPPGSQIVLDAVAQQTLLETLRQQISPRWATMLSEVQALRPASLHDYLASGRTLPDVLRKGTRGRSWAALRRAADPSLPPISAVESELLRRIRAFAHVDDRERAQQYPRLMAEHVNGLSSRERRLAAMLFFSFHPSGQGFASLDQGLESLNRMLVTQEDLREVVDFSFDIARRTTQDLVHYGPDFSDVPLSIHASYQREEILAAVDHASLKRPPSNFREGVAWCGEINSDVLFVTCRKAEKDFSPSTMYKDFAITPELFHWESQSTTAEHSPTGQRYIHHQARGSHVLLFVRTVQEGELGTSPYVFLGPVQYVSHEHSRPMAVTWRLHTPMPTDLYMATRMAST